VIAWLRNRLAKWADERRGKKHFAAAEGSLEERCFIVALMLAIEAREVVKQTAKLTPNDQLIFMMGYECCMMWAIKSGMEKVVKPERVQSAVLAMKRHLAKHAWYESTAFEKIWARTDVMMPIGMNAAAGPDAPPPFPVAEMLISLNQAGYPLNSMNATNLHFGMQMFLTMVNLSRAAASIAQEKL
jgi:hypothetical protein